MNAFFVVLGAVLPVFAMAGAGVAMRKLQWLLPEADRSLLRITINLLAPCLIVDSILGNAALEEWDNVLLAPVVGFATVAMGVGVGLLARYWLRLPTAREERTFAFSLGIYNYGYVPIPLALLLYDRETVGVLIVHNVGVELAFWSIGLLLLAGASVRAGWRRLINPPTGAILIALLLNGVGGDAVVPAFILTAARLLGQCAIPMGLILIGATIADHIGSFHSREGWRVVASACLLRLGLLPVLFLLVAKYLPCSIELKRVLVLQAAMPSAVFTIIMAKHYQGDPPTALRVVLATTALGLITIPLWIRFGSTFVGL